MIAEFGHFALILALMVAIVQAIVPLYGAQKGVTALMATAKPAALLQFMLILTSFLALMHGFITSDFSLAVVAQNSHSAKPMLYKVTGVWGNHEGSMLLWVLILSLFGACVAATGKNLPRGLFARVLSVQSMIGIGFLLFILLTSNPFARLDPAPLNGQDLNPLLQDPGLAFHPPFLYLGYVGFSMAFAFAIAALIEGRVDAAWARWVRPWTLAAWCFLTIGIALGSWWAYYELGWGGWWFWDPVENASFMPWLAGTALLHTAIVVEKRETLKNWTILLAILAFSLSLIGTFLVRSGVLTSVHAFATSPERGIFILALLAVAIGGSLTLYAIRAPKMRGGGLFAPISREGALLFNNIILSAATATVFVGTLFPLAAEALSLGKFSVGAPYFNATFSKLMMPLLLAVPIGAVLGWKRGHLLGALQRLWVAAVVSLILMIVVWAYISDKGSLAPIGMGLALWIVIGTLVEFADRIKLFRTSFSASMSRLKGLPRSAFGMTTAHIGLGIVLAGIVSMSAWKEEKVLTARPGDNITFSGYEFTFNAVKQVSGPNYGAERADFTLKKDDKEITRLFPEKRFYPVQQMTTTEAAIHTTWLADIYTVVGDQHEDGSWTVRLYHNPLAPWLWLGSGVLALGGFISMTDRRLRVGVAQKLKHTKPVEQAV
ncbi:MAG: heme lyase CcmF/NrfE family subunit [Sphingomonadales bacterium]|jgi:cytochrome c-type biogenesis protein CcmF